MENEEPESAEETVSSIAVDRLIKEHGYAHVMEMVANSLAKFAAEDGCRAKPLIFGAARFLESEAERFE